MGICNVTPDSFSDGGRYLALSDALEHCAAMLAEGADLIDVGGESTRPGAPRVEEAEELRRVLPLVKELVERGVPVSVDTTRSRVALAAVEAGAVVINDVSGGLADPDMMKVMSETGVVSVLMHWRGPSSNMDQLDSYTDVVAEVAAELHQRVEVALETGVKPAALVLDPGLGFAKTGASNWPLLAHLDRLAQPPLPLLVGASRKRFLQGLGGTPNKKNLGISSKFQTQSDLGAAVETSPADRDAATAAVTMVAALAGAWCVRVHAVGASAAACRVAQAIVAAQR
jgi:dihydropteroate synthase